MSLKKEIKKTKEKLQKKVEHLSKEQFEAKLIAHLQNREE